MAIGNKHKKLAKTRRGEIIMLVDTNVQTHRHTHHNTPLSSPLPGTEQQTYLKLKIFTHSNAHIIWLRCTVTVSMDEKLGLRGLNNCKQRDTEK